MHFSFENWPVIATSDMTPPFCKMLRALNTEERRNWRRSQLLVLTVNPQFQWLKPRILGRWRCIRGIIRGCPTTYQPSGTHYMPHGLDRFFEIVWQIFSSALFLNCKPRLHRDMILLSELWQKTEAQKHAASGNGKSRRLLPFSTLARRLEINTTPEPRCAGFSTRP